MGYRSSISPTLNLLMTSGGKKKLQGMKRYSKYCTFSDLSKKGFLLGSSPTHSSPASTLHQQFIFNYLQGWRVSSLFQQPVPMLNHSPGEKYLFLVRQE